MFITKYLLNFQQNAINNKIPYKLYSSIHYYFHSFLIISISFQKLLENMQNTVNLKKNTTHCKKTTGII